MKKRCFGDVIDVGFKGESRVHVNSKVSDEGRICDSVAINAKCEVLTGREEGFGAKDDDFSLIAVKFEEVVVHPIFNIC